MNSPAQQEVLNYNQYNDFEEKSNFNELHRFAKSEHQQQQTALILTIFLPYILCPSTIYLRIKTHIFAIISGKTICSFPFKCWEL